ncbi:helix-turn-helix domain-containing protein [Modestobacter altitudinis]|uniref:helix-turn-helix domain-containing protein n=1 Tax=Modestobacter altitudinis TaxID=2213158 RepID=UPI00110CE544|nr:helix-turn-helix domain-containing protein [Modestobacter altitudinis]
MVTLLDTDQLPPAERRPAQVVARLEATMVSRVRFAEPGAASHARLDGWDLGGVPVLRAALAGDPVLARSARAAREDVVPTVSFAVQEVGVGMQEQFGAQRTVPRGGLVLTELASPYEYRWVGPGVCRALQVPVSRLGLPVDDVRRALPLAHRSPLYGLVRAHLTEVTRDAERLAGEPLVHALASATVDLTRALLASAAGPTRSVEDVAAETLLTRVRSYVRQHLIDPGLDAEQVAAAHAISVRQLYRVCAAAHVSLEQWIIHQRLEGARAELASPRSRDRSIAVIARHWGFTDPSYFSRRFRATFGLTPRDWRRTGAGALALPRPRPELDLTAPRPAPPAGR